jgi:hypothetical protein
MIVLEIERIDERLAWRSCRSNDLGQSGDGGAILKWASDFFDGVHVSPISDHPIVDS